MEPIRYLIRKTRLQFDAAYDIDCLPIGRSFIEDVSNDNNRCSVLR